MAVRNKLSAHLIPLHWGQWDYAQWKRIAPASIKTIYGFDRVPTDFWSMSPKSLFGLRDHAMSEQHDDLFRNPVETGKRHAREWMEKLERWNWTHIPREQLYVHSINEPNVWVTEYQLAQTRNLSNAGTFEYMAYLKQQAFDQLQQTLVLRNELMVRDLTPLERDDLERSEERSRSLVDTIGVRRTVEYTEAWLDALTSYGIRGTALNLSVGWPANAGTDMPPVWEPYLSLENKILKGNHFLVVHEYWPKEGPLKHWGWMAGRALKCPMNVPIIIGECGHEERVVNSNLPSEKWGWQAWLTKEQYIAQLNQYNELMEDPRIHSLQIFTSDFSHPFGSTDIRSILDLLPTNNHFDYMLNYAPPVEEDSNGSSDPTVIGLTNELIKIAESKQVIQFNPDAALQKRIFKDGFVPNSPEFEHVYNKLTFIAQRAESLKTGEVRVYYVQKGDWTNVQYTTRV